MQDHTIRTHQVVHSLSDEQLLQSTAALLSHSRHDESDLLAHIGEIDVRCLYARFAVSSMFGYCTSVLHLAEHEAYMRITAARAARVHPVLLAMLADGRLHLTGVVRLAPHLTTENCETVPEQATHKSMRQIEELIAELSPQPDAPAVIRKLPERGRAAEALLPMPAGRAADREWTAAPLLSASPGTVGPGVGDRATEELVSKRVAVAAPIVSVSPAASIRPTAPGRYKVQFTASATLRDKLERLQDLMPQADLAVVIEVAVSEKLARLEARRFGAVRAPREASGKAMACRPPGPVGAGGKKTTSSRRIPAAVRRTVWERDGGRCRYVDAQGRRCDATRRLELHHRYPFGYGGGPTVDNICLMCRTHNRRLAVVDYGREYPARHDAGSRRQTPAAAAPG